MTTLRDRATRRTKTIAVVALPVILVAAFALASYTSLFATRDIRIEGAVTLTRADVLRLAGIGPGTNVFHLDADAVARALVADPWIATASVERHLPGTVVIRLEEREPIARSTTGSTTGSTTVVLAGDGVILPGASADGLPEIRASVGELSDDARTGAARALASLERILRARVAAVVVQPSGELVMDLAGELTVHYGTPGDDAAKATALRAVLAWAAEQDEPLREIDVTVPEAPSATLVGGSTVTP
jgi:cell division protein FtsQ